MSKRNLFSQLAKAPKPVLRFFNTKPNRELVLNSEPSPKMLQFKAEHDVILDQFEATARLGHVPADALIEQLHANHHEALAETKRQLSDAEEALLCCLRQLNARFPAPLPPEPEKPIPPRPKVISPLAKIWPNPRRSGPFTNVQ